MATHRSYHDSCGMAHALDLVGERWSLLVIRELVLGAKRYSDLKSDLPGISSNVLSDRLAELERHGILVRRKLSPPAASWVYELTDWGHELEPVIRDLGRWGARSPQHPQDQHLSVASAVLSMRTNIDVDSIRGVSSTVGIRFGEEAFEARMDGGRFAVEPGVAHAPDVTVDTDPMTFAGLLFGGLEPRAAEQDGLLTVTGDREALQRFLGYFRLPAKAPAVA